MRSVVARTGIVVILLTACGASNDSPARPPTNVNRAGQTVQRPSPTRYTNRPPIEIIEPANADSLSPALRGPVSDTESSQAPVTIYGRAGSFGNVQNGVPYPSTNVQPIQGWGFLPGQAAYFAAVDGRGRVLIANEPQTDNQTIPTAATMAVSVFDPAAAQFENIVMPTSTGALSAVALDGSGIGGADIADLQVIDRPDGQQVVVTSMAPYNGWDAVLTGIYPALGMLHEELGEWVPGKQYSGSDLRASGVPGAAMCNRDMPAAPGPVVDCWGLAEIGQLPVSKLLVATRYFSDPTNDQSNGGVAVLSPEGVVVAVFDYPSVVVGGRHLRVHAREVDVDPTSGVGDERFLVVFDVAEGGSDGATQFVAQEFRFDIVSATITPVSIPFTTGGVLHGVAVGVETAGYDHDGNLWIAESRSNSLDGGRLVRYSPAGTRSQLSTTCAATPGSAADKWGMACFPDLVSDAPTGRGLVRSLTEDETRHRMIAITTGGSVIVASASDSRVALDLPLNELVDRYRYSIGPRKGATSPDGSMLWVPIQQLRSPAVCASAQCAPTVLDQWLAGIQLSLI